MDTRRVDASSRSDFAADRSSGEDWPGDDWFDDIPKVELHLHLEGAIPLPAMWELVKKYGATDQVPTIEALARRFRYTDFDHFIEAWVWKCGLTRELDDFTLIAQAVATHLRDQNIRYVEAFYSPPDYAVHGLSTADITHAVRAGLDRVADIRVNLVADLVRDYGVERAARTLEELAEVADQGVIGIGIGGSEGAYPPEPFARVYARARELGFRTSAHAGEAAGAASVWGAVRELGVDRIGHGTRASEDPALIEHLAEHRIPLEMCPISNVRTAVIPDLEAHPIRNFLDRGLLVTVNTDDPAMFQTSLAHEYRELCRVHGLRPADILGLIDNAVTACWLDDQDRDALRQSLHDNPAWTAGQG
jgi:adenosine deaminase